MVFGAVTITHVVYAVTCIVYGKYATKTELGFLGYNHSVRFVVGFKINDFSDVKAPLL
jgi:hypothetical protein